MNKYQPGLTLVAVGVLIVVLARPIADDNAVWISIPGAIITAIGAALIFRNRNNNPEHTNEPNPD